MLVFWFSPVDRAELRILAMKMGTPADHFRARGERRRPAEQHFQMVLEREMPLVAPTSRGREAVRQEATVGDPAVQAAAEWFREPEVQVHHCRAF